MKSPLPLLVISVLLISGCAQGGSKKSAAPKLTAAEANNQKMIRNCEIRMPHLIDFSAYYQSGDFLMALDAITYRAGSLSVLSYSEKEGTLLNATNRSERIASIQLNNGVNKSKEINQFLKDIDLYIDFCDSLTIQ
jgi:hypothetical protein